MAVIRFRELKNNIFSFIVKAMDERKECKAHPLWLLVIWREVYSGSGANAIHGVVIIGAIIVMGQAPSDDYLALTLGFLAVILGTLNVVGGFVVTDRMLEMFDKKKKKK